MFGSLPPIELTLALPRWLHQAADFTTVYPDDDGKMRLAIALSARNVDERFGGPFGAAVFDGDDRLVAVAVNGVMPLECSLAHAETMALALAQRAVGRARLNLDADDRPIGRYTLAASSQPCCQCYGALLWGGLDRLIVGARAEDVTALTEFDEGPLPADWVAELERRGVAVTRDIHRDQACEVLRRYVAQEGARY
jgi:tRNA(Arg) A34 adenosine deaminase TadA